MTLTSLYNLRTPPKKTSSQTHSARCLLLNTVTHPNSTSHVQYFRRESNIPMAQPLCVPFSATAFLPTTHSSTQLPRTTANNNRVSLGSSLMSGSK
ncbi:unnamed protein product [Lathyrus oleraceus]